MREQIFQEIELIKSRLVNIALIVGALAGLPLVISSIFKAFTLGIAVFWIFYLLVYLFVLGIALFRKSLSYQLRASTLILSIFFLGALNLLESGFVSSAYLWFTAAIVLASIYFDFQKGIYWLVLSTLTTILLYLLTRNHYIMPGSYLYRRILPFETVLTNILIVVALSLIISFTTRYIRQKLIDNIGALKKQKLALERKNHQLSLLADERYHSEQLARQKEQNFKNIFDNSSEAIIIVDREKNILEYNAAYKELSGQNDYEIRNTKADYFIPAAEHKLFDMYYQHPELMPHKQSLIIEIPPKGLLYIDVSSRVIDYNEKKAFLFIIRNNTEKVNHERMNYLASLAAEEKERNRFSKELHDGLGPLLSTLKIYLEIYFNNPGDGEIEERIASTLNESIKTVKEVSNNLSPYILENMGITRAVESFIEKVKFRNAIKIDFESNLQKRLLPEIEISIYRIASELINNTIKHANATQIVISLSLKANYISIHYKDNGCGFDMKEIKQKAKGIGLFNLQSRIENLNGSIQMKTAPDQGFELNAQVQATGLKGDSTH
ncbi:ATP-binding protein [Roseimarinus sediminis]|uniref:ATP-binding protein n=1 Tax=Roseimarinus sediminis TaxID=1610899 RepID=UPI003D22148E